MAEQPQTKQPRIKGFVANDGGIQLLHGLGTKGSMRVEPGVEMLPSPWPGMPGVLVNMTRKDSVGKQTTLSFVVPMSHLRQVDLEG